MIRRQPMTEITGIIEKDFEECNCSGSRCACCHRMQPRETPLFWVSSSAHFYKNDGYARLAYTSNQDTSRSGWCKSCIEATKNIKDNFVIPVAK